MASQDPFASMGGGVQLPDGGWVPRNHPLAQQYLNGSGQGQQQSQGAQTGAPAATTVNQQAQNAQTYSATPGAAPAPNTTNQGTQDVVRNTYLQQATQGTTVDRNDPNVRSQVDPFAAAQDRARRQYESEAAERLSTQGLGNSGAMTNERRIAAERAGQATGQFESAVVAHELQNKRDEVQNALTNLRGLISNDQAMALQKELAELDAALKREGLAQSGQLGNAELALKDKLGTGSLNVDLMRALLQNQQFGTDAGIRIGEDEMNYYLRQAGL